MQLKEVENVSYAIALEVVLLTVDTNPATWNKFDKNRSGLASYL